MALPVSGPLSINDIRNALGSSSGSLRTLSSLAGFSTPDKISDFYGYSPSSGVVFTAVSGLYPVSGGSSTCVGTLTNYGPSLVAIKGLFNSAGISSGTVGNNRVYYRAYSGGPTIYVYFLNQTITSFGQNILTNRDSDNIRLGWFYLPVGATYDITIDKFDGAGSGSTFRLAQSSTPDGTYTAI